MFGPLSDQFCARLGIEHPVIQAPMAGGWTTPELAAAVSNAGGLGFLAATGVSAEQMGAEIAAMRELTDRPFGINFLLAPPGRLEQRDVDAMQRVLDGVRVKLSLPPGSGIPSLPSSPMKEQLDLVAQVKVPVVSFSMGLPPAGVVSSLKDSGAFVIIGVTTVNEALQAVDAGADALVAQGAEAGGHRFTLEVSDAEPVPLIGTFVLVPQVADAVSVPVIAAGGIMDGRGLAAAVALGASAAQMGTRFLLSNESNIFPAYREHLLEGTEESTVITTAYTGRHARGLRNEMVKAVEGSGVKPLPWPYQRFAAGDIYEASAKQDDVEWFPALAGQGLRMVKRDQSAGEIVKSVVEEAEAVMKGIG